MTPVRIIYDREARAHYVKVRAGGVDRTAELEPGILVDLDMNGALLGVELLKPVSVATIESLAKRFDAPTLADALTALHRLFSSSRIDQGPPA